MIDNDLNDLFSGLSTTHLHFEAHYLRCGNANSKLLYWSPKRNSESSDICLAAHPPFAEELKTWTSWREESGKHDQRVFTNISPSSALLGRELIFPMMTDIRKGLHPHSQGYSKALILASPLDALYYKINVSVNVNTNRTQSLHPSTCYQLSFHIDLLSCLNVSEKSFISTCLSGSINWWHLIYWLGT